MFIFCDNLGKELHRKRWKQNEKSKDLYFRFG